MLKKVSLLVVLVLLLLTGTVTAAQPAADGSAAWPGAMIDVPSTEPEIQFAFLRGFWEYRREPWTRTWSYMGTFVRCNWTHRCVGEVFGGRGPTGEHRIICLARLVRVERRRCYQIWLLWDLTHSWCYEWHNYKTEIEYKELVSFVRGSCGCIRTPRGMRSCKDHFGG